MSAVWWGRDRTTSAVPELVPGPLGPQPQLAEAARQAVQAELLARRQGFTPQWTPRHGDAGLALVRLFSEQMEPVLERVNRLPEKAAVEFLGVAGIGPLPARAAETLLEFEVDDAAPRSVLVPRGFQVGASPAGGGEPVTFETQRTLFAAPATITKLVSQRGVAFEELAQPEEPDEPGAGFRPFGRRSAAGMTLWIGLSPTEAEIGPTLTLGIGVAAPPASPPPVGLGGVVPLPVQPAPLLRWLVADGGRVEPAEVVLDETARLSRSGVVELRLPRRWRPSPPPGMRVEAPAGTAAQGRWIGLRIIYGTFPKEPVLSYVRLNVARARAARTIRDEALAPVPNGDGRRWRLSQKPVLPGTLILEVDDGGSAGADESAASVSAPVASSAQQESASDALAAADSDSTETPAPAESGGDAGSTDPGGRRRVRRWREVETLATHGADAEVFVLDAAAGEVTFGDGRHGATPPPGFRHIRAASYQAGGGAAGSVEAGAASAMLSSARHLTAVKNPAPAAGGTDREAHAAALRRGPQELRSRGRAVTAGDYALLARRAAGADVRRAHAVSGLHPAAPGRPVPGVVAVFVVPPDPQNGTPPTPSEHALRAVAGFLSRDAAPAGVEVVAAAPRYHAVRVDTGVRIDPAADAGETVGRILRTLDRYLHPLDGGDDGRGWPFGGTVRYAPLLRLVASVRGVAAVATLNLTADGFRLPACADYTPSPHSLLWPQGHEVAVLETGGSS